MEVTTFLFHDRHKIVTDQEADIFHHHTFDAIQTRYSSKPDYLVMWSVWCVQFEDITVYF